MVEALRDPKEPLFFMNLCQNVKVHSFKPLYLEISIPDYLGRPFIAEIKSKLLKLTGENWTIDRRENAQGESLFEKEKREINDVLIRFKELPEIKTMLKRFPQTQIEIE